MSGAALGNQTFVSDAQTRERLRVIFTEYADSEQITTWNLEDECRRYRTDPVERFVRPASKFALLASSFTRHPIVSALRSSAAALEALNAAAGIEYEQSFSAWDANFKLALKRQQIEHESFLEASRLMQTDVASATSKAMLNAARFKDRIATYCIEKDLLNEWSFLHTLRKDLMLELSDGWPKIQTNH